MTFINNITIQVKKQQLEDRLERSETRRQEILDDKRRSSKVKASAERAIR